MGNPPNSENDFEESTNEDLSVAQKNLTENNEWTDKIAFVNLKNYDNFESKSQRDIILSIFNENSVDLVPDFVIKNFHILKLVFLCKEQRDAALQTKISIFHTLVDVEPPRVPSITKKLTLHLSKIPIEVSHEDVSLWLKQQVTDLQVVSDFRWTTLKDCPIKTGERTVVVTIPKKSSIPGFAWFKTQKMANSLKIRIWHFGIGAFCHKCMLAGHDSKACTARPQNVRAATFSEAAKKAVAQPPIEEERQDVEAFWTYKDVFSNHYPATFTQNGIAYKSTEHFLFSAKALKVGAFDTAKQVREAEHAAKAKFIGEHIPWDEAMHGPWETFAHNTLWIANNCKYEQNPELREQLLATAPKLLVEASPKDTRWGAGLAKSSPLICYPTLYPGRNLFGLLLTKLRDNMMEKPVKKRLATSPADEQARKISK